MLLVFAPRRASAAVRVASVFTLALATHLLVSPPSHAAGKAHAHGNATLDVVVEPQKLTIQVSSPLDNLIGFERAPRSDKERQQTDAAIARLKAAEALFGIDPSAQCKPSKVELSSAALKLGKPDPADEK